MSSSWLSFFVGSIHNFRESGTVFPTSRATALAMIAPIASLQRGSQRPLRILEVGCGTGAITIPLIGKLSNADQLVVCDSNYYFIEVLKKKIARLPEQAKLPKIVYLNKAIQDTVELDPFVYIICSIPFLRLDVTNVKIIIDKLQQLASPNATLIFVEYIGARELAKTFGPQHTRKRVKEIEEYFASLPSFNYHSKVRVWANLFPLNIYSLPLRGRLAV